MPRITLSDRVVGARIREARQRKGWHQNDLAKAVGVHVSSVRKWELAEIGFPESRIHEVAEALNVPPADLYPRNVVELTADEADLIAAYRRIGTPMGRQRVMAQLEMGRRMASC